MIEASISNNTWKAYDNAVLSFQNFRNQYKLRLDWPPSVGDLASYISYLSFQSFSPATARSYISGISFYLKCHSLSDTTQTFIIKKMLNGMNRLYNRADLRLPITIDMMSKFSIALRHVCSSQYEAAMFMSAFSLAFSALLRVGEITAENVETAKRIIHRNDVVVDNNQLILTIRFSKTDQFGNSSLCIIPANVNSKFCAVSNLVDYLRVRSDKEGPLYCHMNNKHVTRKQFSNMLYKSLKFLGYDCDNINTHSFRIGGATYLALLGESDDSIKRKGRWSSNSFKRYIRY